MWWRIRIRWASVARSETCEGVQDCLDTIKETSGLICRQAAPFATEAASAEAWVPLATRTLQLTPPWPAILQSALHWISSSATSACTVAVW